MPVALEYLSHVQSAAIGIWIKAGAVDETPMTGAGEGGEAGKWEVVPGISHFAEHMMFKGTEKRSAKEIAEDIDRTGGIINAFTGEEATCYHVKTLSSHIGTAVGVLSDMILNSVFEEAEIEKEKGVIIEEINMNEDSPEDIGQDLIMETVFKDTSLGNRVIGSKESVLSISRDDIRSYVGSRYVTENSLISVAGKFDEAELMGLLEASFGAMPKGSAGRIHEDSPHLPKFLPKRKDIEQSHIFLGRRGVRLLSDDFYAFQLYSSILGGSMSSRLFQAVREEKGLAYSVFSASSAYKNGGLFFIYAGVGFGHEKEAFDAISQEMETLAKGGAEEGELSKVKEQYKGHYIFGLENVTSRMFATGRNMLILGRTISPEEVMEGIDAVSGDRIRAIASEYRDIQDYSKVVISGSEMKETEFAS